MIPDFQNIMLPFLKQLGDDSVHTFKDILHALAEQFKLTAEERSELLPSGTDRKFDNRVGWARTHLSKAGLFETVQRGKYRIAPRGLEVLASNPKRIDVALLKQFPEYLKFIAPNKEISEEPAAAHNGKPGAIEVNDKETPLESLEKTYSALRKSLADDLLQKIGETSPKFFEWLVVNLLVAMGYGGSRKDAGQAIGQTGDEGIDGTIKEDRLGLDAIYVQAKRWKDTTVGRPHVQGFAGSLEGHRARKGVFITTSQFSADAHEFVKKIGRTIILIDGQQLANLCIDYGIGVADVTSYTVKRIDMDYFDED